MKPVSAAHLAAWKSPDKSGANRPIVRATISQESVKYFNYDLADTLSPADGTGRLASLYFSQTDQPIELPNIAKMTWQRDVDNDCATATITLWNTEILPIGAIPEGADAEGFERLGWFTPRRGETTESQTRWGQTLNGWQSIIVPDRVIKTYEGYGFDPAVAPEDDPNLYPSGTWFIDDVYLNDQGDITLECRDFFRVLSDLICMPPVVPWGQYPISWEPTHLEKGPKQLVGTATSTNWFRPTYKSDSNRPYIGRGFTDGGRAYVDSNGGVLGHYGRHAFDNDTSTYWLSVGNMSDWSSAFEWVEGTFSARSVNAVRVRTWGGPYRVYVSLRRNGKWIGAKRIPYKARVVDAGTAIRFVKSQMVGKGKETEIVLGQSYDNVTGIRITLSHLYDSGIGYYRWRAGVRDIHVHAETSKPVYERPDINVGNFNDYGDIVKWFLGWAGFYWPKGADYAYITKTDGSVDTFEPPSDDGLFPIGGRIWGDLMDTGTKAITKLDEAVWDKKTLLECVQTIKDIVGFVLFCDEKAGAIWRLPNLYTVGNYLWNVDGGPALARTTDVHDIDETETLTGINVKISSRNVRDRILVANLSGNIGAVAQGYNPYPNGLVRLGGWTDQHFASQRECQIMADLIAIRQAFQYRTNTITIPGNAAIQIDDQVRVHERITQDTYLHYVKGIASEWDNLTGKWTYQLTTYWLGEEPFGSWAFDPAELANETKQYLEALGVPGTGAVGTPPPVYIPPGDDGWDDSPLGGGGTPPYTPPASPPAEGAILYGSCPTSSSSTAAVDDLDSQFGGIDVLRSFNTGFPSSWSNDNARHVSRTGAVAVIQSMKPSVAQMASGSLNAALKSYYSSIPIDESLKKFVCVQHEPENPSKGINAADWRKAWANVKSIVAQVREEQGRTDLFTCQILMAWTLDKKSGRNPEDWYAGTDVLGWDCYTVAQIGYARDYSKAKGKPWLIAELGTNDLSSDSGIKSELLTDYSGWVDDPTNLPIAVAYFNANVKHNYIITDGSRPLTKATWESFCSTGGPP